ncbi:hypothetical protein, partial [[Clostridium] symbiosum]|uniref:hypothetical protein n=1 Tax=Clostridium symbiosum TaxID=1512 RepID=UPI001D085ABF
SPHPASFRFHLTMNTLAFGYILPTTGRIPDFHRLETCAAGRTDKKRSRQAASVYHAVCRLRFDNAPSFLLFWPFMHQKSILLPSSADW